MGLHTFSAVAFVENISVRELAAAFPGSRVMAHELRHSPEGGGVIFAYPFGALVFRDVSPDRREAAIGRLRAAFPRLTAEVIREEFLVREEAATPPGVADGVLVVDRLTEERSGIVALTVAQSAAMEYYERIVDQLFSETTAVASRLEESGAVPLRTRPLNRFIGAAISTRGEVIAVLHLLDKPDATWEDPAMDRIYGDLRAEFDLTLRFRVLEAKLRGVQEALELVVGVARDRQFLFLDIAIVLLIVLEILLSFLRLR